MIDYRFFVHQLFQQLTKLKWYELYTTIYNNFFLIRVNIPKATIHLAHRRTGNFLPGGAVNHLPIKFSQVAQIFTKQSSYDTLT